MRCFYCNVPCGSTNCPKCAEAKANQRRSNSVWNPSAVRTRSEHREQPKNDSFGKALRAALKASSR